MSMSSKEIREYVENTKKVVAMEVPKAIRKADKKVLPQLVSPLHTALGKVEIIARRAEQMSIANTGKQTADCIDNDARFKNLQKQIFALKEEIRALVDLKKQYWEGVNEARRYLKVLRDESKAIAEKLKCVARD